MARRPRNQRESLIDQWFYYIFEPRRFVRLLVLVVIASLLVDAYQHPAGVQQFISLLIQLTVVIGGIWLLFTRVFFPKKKGKGGH